MTMGYKTDIIRVIIIILALDLVLVIIIILALDRVLKCRSNINVYVVYP
jgi:hypothetical protein